MGSTRMASARCGSAGGPARAGGPPPSGRGVRGGWGHSSFREAVACGELAGVRRLILFHHDPSHSDAVLDELTEAARARGTSIEVVAGREGARYDLGVHA